MPQVRAPLLGANLGFNLSDSIRVNPLKSAAASAFDSAGTPAVRVVLLAQTRMHFVFSLFPIRVNP